MDTDFCAAVLRNGYIDSRAEYSTTIRTMAKAIAVQETAGTHFWPTGYHIGGAAHNRYPIVAQRRDKGYGVMQLTAADFLNRDTIWNWKANIDQAMSYLNDPCYSNGVNHLNRHPAGVTDEMRRLEGYDRYNAGPYDRYHWWNDTPRPGDNLPN